MKLLVMGLLIMGASLLSFLYMHGPPGIKAPAYVPVQGMVTAKEWVPASTDVVTIFTGPVPTSIFLPNPEKFIVYVGARWTTVSREDFKTIEIGKYWSEQKIEK